MNSLEFGNEIFIFKMKLIENIIIINCNHKNNFKEWIVEFDELKSENNELINAKNLFEVISKCISNDYEFKKYFEIKLPDKENEEPYIKIIQINHLKKELEVYYLINFASIEIEDTIRFQKQFDLIFKKISNLEKMNLNFNERINNLLLLFKESSNNIMNIIKKN